MLIYVNLIMLTQNDKKQFWFEDGDENEDVNVSGSYLPEVSLPPDLEETEAIEISSVQTLLIHQRQRRWELNWQEAAIYLQEGRNNDKFTSHPRYLCAD